MLELAEIDYVHGVGMLALRITRLAVDPAHYPGIEWVYAEGVVLYPNGDVGTPRPVNIRAAAIEAALRPEGWLPPRYTAPQPLPRRAAS